MHKKFKEMKTMQAIKKKGLVRIWILIIKKVKLKSKKNNYCKIVLIEIM